MSLLRHYVKVRTEAGQLAEGLPALTEAHESAAIEALGVGCAGCFICASDNERHPHLR
jgi:hypothetical protein